MIEGNANPQNTIGPNQLSSNPIPNSSTNANSILLIIIAILLTAIVAGGGVYLWLTTFKQQGSTLPPDKPLISTTTPINETPTQTILPEDKPLVNQTSTPSPTIKQTGLPYENTEFGFNLMFPETWKGFVYRKELIDFGGGLNAPVIYFGLPAQKDIFVIGIYTKAQWQTLQASEGPKDQLLGENANYTFGYSLGQYAANDEMSQRRSEVSAFIKTFKTK